MDGEPDRFPFGIRLLHPVANMPGNEEMIPGLEIDRFALFKAKCGASRDKKHPFIRLLVVPETRWRCLPSGDNPLHPEGPRPQDLLNSLPGWLRGNRVKQVVNGNHFRHPSSMALLCYPCPRQTLGTSVIRQSFPAISIFSGNDVPEPLFLIISIGQHPIVSSPNLFANKNHLKYLTVSCITPQNRDCKTKEIMPRTECTYPTLLGQPRVG